VDEILDQGLDHATKRRADDHANGEIDDVSAQQEFLEPAQRPPGPARHPRRRRGAILILFGRHAVPPGALLRSLVTPTQLSWVLLAMCASPGPPDPAR